MDHKDVLLGLPTKVGTKNNLQWLRLMLNAIKQVFVFIFLVISSINAAENQRDQTVSYEDDGYPIDDDADPFADFRNYASDNDYEYPDGDYKESMVYEAPPGLQAYKSLQNAFNSEKDSYYFSDIKEIFLEKTHELMQSQEGINLAIQVIRDYEEFSDFLPQFLTYKDGVFLPDQETINDIFSNIVGKYVQCHDEILKKKYAEIVKILLIKRYNVPLPDQETINRIFYKNCNTAERIKIFFTLKMLSPDQETVDRVFEKVAHENKLDIAKLLLFPPKHVPAPRQEAVDRAFESAAENGNTELMNMLLRQNQNLLSNINLLKKACAQEKLEWYHNEKDTLTVFAKHKRLDSMVCALITPRFFPIQEDVNNAFKKAAENADIHMIELLLAPHEGVPLPNQEAVNYAFECAVRNWNINIIELLQKSHEGVPLPVSDYISSKNYP